MFDDLIYDKKIPVPDDEDAYVSFGEVGVAGTLDPGTSGNSGTCYTGGYSSPPNPGLSGPVPTPNTPPPKGKYPSGSSGNTGYYGT